MNDCIFEAPRSQAHNLRHRNDDEQVEATGEKDDLQVPPKPIHHKKSEINERKKNYQLN